MISEEDKDYILSTGDFWLKECMSAKTDALIPDGYLKHIGNGTARELHDALLNNWQGYEELHRYIKNEAPHYGKGIKEMDQYAKWAADVFGDAVNSCTGPRGRFSAGLYPVTIHVIFGRMTAATPDGRYAGEPLADGISPVQQMDTKGPTATLVSASNIDQSKFSNGTLLNMKFHPSSMNGEDGIIKLTNLIQTYFSMGGMELQMNVVSADTLKDAQKNPDKPEPCCSCRGLQYILY